MFEDQPNNQVPPPANLPSEPMDMFAGMEEGAVPAVQAEAGATGPKNALGAGVLKPKATMAVSPTGAAGGEPQVYVMKEPVIGKVFMSILVVVVLGALGYGGWWGYNKYFRSASPTAGVQMPLTQQPQTPAAVPQNQPTATSEIPAQMNNDQILFGQAVDTDKDGLDDVREKELGTNPLVADTDKDGLQDGEEVLIYKTNPLNPDTDNDGLSDGDEVKIWHTNPLNPDTDGDSYLDGDEVRHGYNPLGPGKLFSSPTSTATGTLNATSTK